MFLPGRPRISPAGLVVGGYPCDGTASSSIPSDGIYYLTSFGGGSDTQSVACSGMPIADGSWYYLADKSRWPCGTRLLISNPANGRSVVAVVADYGPATCVEQAAGRPIIDASPLVSRYLFNSPSSGESDHRAVTATVVDPSTPLGPAGSLTGSAGIVALGIAVATGAAIWYFEARPRHNPATTLAQLKASTRNRHRLDVAFAKDPSLRAEWDAAAKHERALKAAASEATLDAWFLWMDGPARETS